MFKKNYNSNFPDKTLYVSGESSTSFTCTILKLKKLQSKVWRKNPPLFPVHINCTVMSAPCLKKFFNLFQFFVGENNTVPRSWLLIKPVFQIIFILTVQYMRIYVYMYMSTGHFL